jgi:hypothetical protein
MSCGVKSDEWGKYLKRRSVLREWRPSAPCRTPLSTRGDCPGSNRPDGVGPHLVTTCAVASKILDETDALSADTD